MKKLLIIVVLALVVYLVLAWFTPSWMALQGSDVWILRLGLSLIGVAAAAVIVWFLAKKTGSATPPPNSGAQEIDAAVRTAQGRLKTSRGAHGGRIANLPVVLVVGDSGSCKTSVIAQSGLEPELVAGQVLEDNAIIPTASINIWFARNTAFVEAGGKLQKDRGLWAAVVRKVQPTRLRALLSSSAEAPKAALVCVSSEDLLQAGGDRHIALARSLRDRLDAICGTLAVKLPVYVLLTKSDRLTFFSEFARNLTNDEANRVLGATLPIQNDQLSGVYSESATQKLQIAFDNLVYSLCDRRPDLLSRENDGDKLSGIYEFPRELRKLKTPVVQFLVELCKPTQLGPAPFLRGFYFTGVRATFVSEPVRQAPVQSVPKAAAMAADATRFFNVAESAAASAAAAPAQSTRKKPQWVFLSHFFSEVLLQDRAAMGASSKSAKTTTLKRIALATASVACLLLSVALLVSFSGNRRLAAELTAAAQFQPAASERADNGLPSAAALTQLEQFRTGLQRIAEYRRDGAPLRLRWGLYVGDRLYSPARTAYFARFRGLLFNDTQTALASTLRRLPATPGATDEYGPVYDELKAYLITTAHHDKSDAAFLSPVLMQHWSAGRNIDAERTALTQRQMDFYAEELKEANPYSSDYDKPAVDQARRYLSQFAGTERVYQFMLSEASKKFPSINFNRQFAMSAQTVIAAKEVSGAYSKAGWSFMNDAIKNAERFFSGEEWVLGTSGGVALDRRQIEQSLRQRYTSDFINQWREFLKSANVVRYANVKEASQKLTAISGNQSPLLALFWTVSQNTGVESPDIQSAFQPVHFILPPASVDKYIGEKNSPYVNALVTLQAQLEQMASSTGSNEALAAQAASAALQAKVASRQLAQNFKIDSEAHIEAVVQKLMEDPIVIVESLVRNIGPAELNAKGKGLCTQLRDFTAKYPFTPGASAQATLAEFNALFQPQQGAIWTFYDLNLKTQLIRQGTQFAPSPNATINLNPAFIAFWNRVAAISDAAYPNNTTQPRLSFSIKPQQMEAIEDLTFSIEDQKLKASDNAAKQFVWPASGRSEVKLTGKFGRGPELAFFNYDGPWAVFQFFGDADRWTSNGSVHTLEWVLRQGRAGRPLTLSDGTPLTLRFDVDMGKTPPLFQKGYLSGIGCVPDIARP